MTANRRGLCGGPRPARRRSRPRGGARSATARRRPAPHRDELLARGVRVRDGWTVTEALPGRAGPRLEAVVIDRITGEGATAGDGVAVACDLIVTSAGVAPLGQLACGVGARFVYDDALASFRVEGQPEGVWLAGSVDHRHELAAVLADGAAAGDRGRGRRHGARPGRPECRSHPWPIFPHADGKDFVDFDEDQTVERPASTPWPTASTTSSSPSATPRSPWVRARAAIRPSTRCASCAARARSAPTRSVPPPPSARPSCPRASAISPAAASSRRGSRPCITSIWRWARR